MDSETIATSIVLAGALQLAKPVVETGCKLIETLTEQPLKVVGGMLADSLYAHQWRRRIKIAVRAQEILDDKKVAAHVLPEGFLSPLLHNSGFAGDDEIAELWARLIASAMFAEKNQHPGFVGVLSSLSPADARLLQLAIQGRSAASSDDFNVTETDAQKRLGMDASLFQISISNLRRLGLIEDSFTHVLAGPQFAGYQFTRFADFFCEACQVADQFN